MTYGGPSTGRGYPSPRAGGLPPSPASNRTLGERVHDALVAAAEAKSEALRAERLYKRVFAQVLLTAEGKSATDREANARIHPKAIAAEDAWIEAETRANVTRAESDGLQIQFEAWRTAQATARAEMNLR